MHVDGNGRTTRSLACVLMVCLSILAPASLSAAPPEVGERVPDLSLVDLEGRTHTLSERTGEGPVILVFFRGAW